jgi:hypothetical protein
LSKVFFQPQECEIRRRHCGACRWHRSCQLRETESSACVAVYEQLSSAQRACLILARFLSARQGHCCVSSFPVLRGSLHFLGLSRRQTMTDARLWCRVCPA